jgi:16S rRNA processing protein RimM
MGSRVRDEASGRELTVRSIRRNRRGAVVALAEVTDREGAEALRGARLVVPAGEARALGPQEYWDHELIGCEVVTKEGRSVGRVTDVLHTPANDVLVAQGPGGEHLIAFVAGTVVSVEPGAKITIESTGLLED